MAHSRSFSSPQASIHFDWCPVFALPIINIFKCYRPTTDPFLCNYHPKSKPPSTPTCTTARVSKLVSLFPFLFLSHHIQLSTMQPEWLKMYYKSTPITPLLKILQWFPITLKVKWKILNMAYNNCIISLLIHLLNELMNEWTNQWINGWMNERHPRAVKEYEHDLWSQT